MMDYKIGFGTYPLKGDTCEKAVEMAAEVGYRLIDTATFYENFIPIGNVLKKRDRKQFYVVSKVWPTAQSAASLHNDLQTTLKKLQTDYLDAYLIHWPNSQIPFSETLSAMQKARADGLIRDIGFCNVTVNHLKRALSYNIPITWVQIEMHPYFCDFDVLQFCHDNNIKVQAWAPLARGKVKNDELLISIGNKYHKTPAQVAIRWCIQHGVVPLPSSKDSHHLQQNFEVMDFRLTTEEMNEIDQRAKNGKRERIPKDYGLGFTDEFDLPFEECWAN